MKRFYTLFCLSLFFVVNFHSSVAMQSSDMVGFVRPQVQGAEKQLWDLVFKACKQEDQAVEKIVANCLRTLVAKGVNLNATYDVQVGNPEVTEFLGSNTVQYTPLTFAISSKKSLLVSTLLELGANVNELSSMGTPLHCAITSRNTDAIVKLLKRGADINTPDQWGQTVVFGALYDKNHEALGHLLAHEGIDCNWQDNAGQTPLHYAVLRDNPHKGMIKKLLENGVDPTLKDRLGASPIEYARMANDHRLIALLEGKPANSQRSPAVLKSFSNDVNLPTSKKKKKKKKNNKKNNNRKRNTKQKRTASHEQLKNTSPTKKTKATPESAVVDKLKALDIQAASKRALQFGVASPREASPRKKITLEQIDDRVSQWFDDAFLATQKREACSELSYQKSVRYHQIPFTAIATLVEHGKEQPRANKTVANAIDTQWSVRGDMVFGDPFENPWTPGKQKQSGFYHCTMNAAGTIYHVGFDAVQDGTFRLADFMPAQLQHQVMSITDNAHNITHELHI